MVIVVDKEKCVGCRTCELACSFSNKGFFCPYDSLIRVFFTEDGDLKIDIPDKCSCSGKEKPLCAELCPTNAIKYSNLTQTDRKEEYNANRWISEH